jgi:uncharacterized protein YjbJ (UPF0337 family)
MNKENLTGKFDQVTGKVKQKVGEAVGDQKLANSGAAQQVKGAAKEAWGNTKDTAADVSDRARAQSHTDSADKAHDVRESITSTAQNAKEKINAKLDDVKHNVHHDDVRQVH